MIGVVLAAGSGTRLRPLTDELPKAMLPVDGPRSILELAVANLAGAGISRILVVTGHAASVIEESMVGLAESEGLTIDVVHNPRFGDMNNAYSLWLARTAFETGCLVVNGDTVHPGSVERDLLRAPDGDRDVTIAVDDVKQLAEEEMKVQLDSDGRVRRISKSLAPTAADGEYIGLARVHPHASDGLAAALCATFEHDASLYYEDGFQELIDRGGTVKAAPIGDVPWVEVDDHDDLAAARQLPHPL